MAKFIPKDEIERLALEFLKKHHAELTLPIPIEHIVEIAIGIEIVPIPNLLSSEQIDGMLSHGKENFDKSDCLYFCMDSRT